MGLGVRGAQWGKSMIKVYFKHFGEEVDFLLNLCNNQALFLGNKSYSLR